MEENNRTNRWQVRATTAPCMGGGRRLTVAAAAAPRSWRWLTSPCLLSSICRAASHLLGRGIQADHQRHHHLLRQVSRMNGRRNHHDALAGKRNRCGRNKSCSLLIDSLSTGLCVLSLCSNRDQSARSKIANLLTKWDTAK